MNRDPLTQASLPAEVAPGMVLGGKFQIVRKLGRGGMGIVFEAHHMDLDERVALKFLRPMEATEKVHFQRFYREARTAAKIKSEHVTRVLDIGKLESGGLYMVMEYLEGNDLGKHLKLRGKLSITDAVDYMLQACDALAEAHANGIVHRDLKPANLFLANMPDGSVMVKVLDFGIAKQADEEVSGLTDTALIFGSVVYMSPEQMKSTRDVDLRTDIYALGVTLYELIAGKPPFQAKLVPELLVQKAQGKPTPLRDLVPDAPEELEKVLDKSFERDLNLRYESIAAFAAALAPFGSGSTKHILARINRIREKESTTRTFSKGKIIPELKQFAKELELELELGGQRESDPDMKKLEWSDEWAEDIASPKRRSVPPVRAPLPSLPKTSGLQIVPGVRAGGPSGVSHEPPPPPVSAMPPTLTSVTTEPQRADMFRSQLPRLYPPEDRSSDLDERQALMDLEQGPPNEAAPAPGSGGSSNTKWVIGLIAVALFGGIGGTVAWLVKSGRVRLPGADPQVTVPAPATEAPPTTAPAAAPTGEVDKPASSRVEPSPSGAPVDPTAAPSASAAPDAPPGEVPPRHLCAPGTKASGECTGGLSAWCDRDEKRIACCDVGLVPSGAGSAGGAGETCGCPPGAPLMPKAIAAGCSLPADAKPLSLGAIQEVIRAKQADFQGCYKALPPDPRRPFASVVVAIELSPEGRVFSARVEHSNAPDKAAEACLASVVEKLRFPPPTARGMKFLHPITLSIGN
jgi:serine/threonine-protein kinase